MHQPKHIILTGGSRGLGGELVQGLLRDGYRVSTCSRTKSELIDSLESSYRDTFFWRSCHVGAADQVEEFMRQAISHASGQLYAAINNAAVARAGILASFPNIDSEEILRVNLLGAIQVARAASTQMLRQQGGGRLINISSIIGSRGYSGLATYSASKAGLDGLTRALARELGSRQITVNSVSPGYMETEMSATLNPSQVAQIHKRTPLGRLATAADILPIVRFLLSEGSAMITGQTIHVDGGISC